jgi:hypothetical protein
LEIRVPPAAFGGIELVVGLLTEELMLIIAGNADTVDEKHFQQRIMPQMDGDRDS